MKELRIKDICDKGSSNLKQKDVEGKNGLYPVYGASGVISHIDTYHQEENYIAIVKDGSGIGRVTFMPAMSSVIGTMQYILPKNGFNINYIGYCLQSLDLSKYKQGAAIPHIYFRDYGERIVKVTEDTDEQQSIVDYLDSAFAKIDVMKANAEKALNEAKALFHASIKEMLKPKEGWEEKTIDDVVSFRNGIAHEKDIEEGGNYIVINSKFVATEGTIRKYTNEQLSPLYTNEIVMVMSDVPKGKTLAKCYIIECDNKYSLNQRICAFKSKGLDVRFLYYMLNRNPNLLKYDNGENQTNLRKKQILDCPVAYPTQKDEQQSIVTTLDSLKSKVDRLQENYDKISQECDALKQAILRQVFE